MPPYQTLKVRQGGGTGPKGVTKVDKSGLGRAHCIPATRLTAPAGSSSGSLQLHSALGLNGTVSSRLLSNAQGGHQQAVDDSGHDGAGGDGPDGVQLLALGEATDGLGTQPRWGS